MIDDAERLDAALNRRHIGASLEDLAAPLREMVDLAMEIGTACSAPLLSPGERDSLYAAVLDRAGSDRRRTTWRRISPQDAALLGGAAAITAVAAAIGVRAVVGHRRHRVLSAAA